MRFFNRKQKEEPALLGRIPERLVLTLEQLEPRIMLSGTPMACEEEVSYGPSSALTPAEYQWSEVSENVPLAGSAHVNASLFSAVSDQRSNVSLRSPVSGLLSSTPEHRTPNTEHHRNEVAILDSSLPDHSTLIAGLLESGFDEEHVIVLDSERDGVAQISDTLAGHEDLFAVHILSHGSEGRVQLGDVWLDGTMLDQYADQLSGWGDSLNEHGDLLLYGCNIASGELGVDFVADLADLTGTDVAASVDATGAAEAGGDWVLEMSSGDLAATWLFEGAALTEYPYLLADKEGTNGNDTLHSNVNENDTLTGKKGNDTYKFPNNWKTDKVVEKAGEGTDTLDFSGVSENLTFTIKKSGEVIVTGAGSNKVTATNVENLKGGSGADTFYFEKNAKLAGTIDGGGGLNTLDYTATRGIFGYKGYNGPVTIDVSNKSATGINSGADNGFSNIGLIIGGKGGDIVTGGSGVDALEGGIGGDTITGCAGNDKLNGNDDNDKLCGEDGVDELHGGEGDDQLDGGAGDDFLYGDAGDDTYGFSSDTWGADKISEDSGKGTDTLNFSEVTSGLTVVVRASNGQEDSGITVTNGDGNSVKGWSDTGAQIGAQHIEVIVSGRGANSYGLHEGWGKELIIDDSKGSHGTLDLSGIPEGKSLTITISPADTSHPDARNKVVVSDGTNTATAYDIENLSGGQGNNTYVFKNGGVIPGTLDVSGQVTLDYSDYGAAANVNFGSPQQVLAPTTTIEHMTTGVEAIAEVKTVTLSSDVRDGSFKLVLGSQVTKKVRCSATSTDGVDSVQSRLRSLKGFENVTVTGENGGPWVITFPVTQQNIDDGKLPIYPVFMTADTSNLRREAELGIEGVEGSTTEKRIWHAATEGTFTLKLGGQVTGDIKYNAKASALESSLENVLDGKQIDSVTGKGTKAEPWIVKLTDTNTPTLEKDVSNLLANFGDDQSPVTIATTTNGVLPVKDVYRVWNNAAGGTFKLTLGPDGSSPTTAPIAFNAKASGTGNTSLKERLEALAVVTGVEVTGNGTPGSPWEITFSNPYHGVTLTKDDAGLLIPGGTVAVTATDASNPTQQKITVNAAGGTFRLSYRGQTTEAIPFGAPDTGDGSVQQRLQALTGITRVGVLKTQTTNPVTYTVTFDEANTDVALLQADGADLLAPTVVVAGSTVPGVIGGLTGMDKVAKVVGGEKMDHLFPPDSTQNVTFDFSGGKGRDAITGGTGNDSIDGGSGNDIIYGGDGTDTISGGSGQDMIVGEAGNDILNGQRGSDRIYGGDGADTIDGGWGDDLIVGGAGNDTLRGGWGADTFAFEGSWGQDDIECGRIERQTDTVDMSEVTTDLTYSFSGGEITIGTGAFTQNTYSFLGKSFKKASGTFTNCPNKVSIKSAGVGFDYRVSKIETGSGNQTFYFGNKWGTVAIDTTKSAGKTKLIDFSAATVALRFTFKADGSLRVEQVGGTDALQDSIPGLSPTSITITKIDQFTTIKSGRNSNIYRVEKGANFAGKLILTGGVQWTNVPATEKSVFSGLAVGHTVDVSKSTGWIKMVNLKSERVQGSPAPDDTKRFTVLSNNVQAIPGIATIQLEDPAGRTNLRASIGDIVYGTAINVLQGDLGSNVFKHRALHPGISILSGLTGADSYRFGNLWGAVAIVEIPDLEIDIHGNPVKLPEALDTLDFSGMIGSIEVDVYQFDLFSDAFAKLIDEFPGESEDEASSYLHNNWSGPDISTNLVLVRDTTLGGLLADAIPAGADSGFVNFFQNVGTSWIGAMDIESIIGPKMGTMTVRFHKGAELRGTISSGKLGQVTLDYSDYGEAISVGLDAGLEFKAPLSAVSGGLIEDMYISYGSASGVSGHRLGGLTTITDLFGDDNPASEFISQFAVHKISKVIGTPFDDTLNGSGRAVTFVGNGGNDTIIGRRDSGDVLDFSGSSDTLVVDLSAGTAAVGLDTLTVSNVQHVFAGTGNDSLTGDAQNNTFFFGEDWGKDVVHGGGGQDVLDFGAIADPSRIEVNGTPSTDKIVVTLGDDTVTAHGDFRVIVRRGEWWPDFPVDSWSREEVDLSQDSIVTAALPAGLTQVTAADIDSAVSVAISLFDGRTLNGQTLSIDDDGRLLDGDYEVLIDPAALDIRTSDLEGTALSSRLPSGVIYIDTTAGDHGWHTDTGTAPAAGDADLLSAVLHELGIRLRFDTSLDVMATDLALGARFTLPDDLGAVDETTDYGETPLETPTLPAGAIDDSTDLTAIVNEAVSRWEAADLEVIGNSGASDPTIPTPTVEIGHLEGGEVARTLTDGTVVLDPTAAGHGWFVDSTPTTDDDVPADRIDLLTVIMHEMGHAMGLGHDIVEGSPDLMDDAVDPGTRIGAPTGTIEAITLESSDQSKISEGLAAFSSWTVGLGEKLDEMFSASVDLPLVDISFGDLFGIDDNAASQLTSNVGELIDKVNSVFDDAAGSVSNTDLADLGLEGIDIDFAPSSNSVSYVVSVDLTSFDRTLDLNLDDFEIGPDFIGLSVDSGLALSVSGDLTLEFAFGLDGQGDFYVEAPAVSASLALNSGDVDEDGEIDTFDASVGLGPLSLGIDDGIIDVGATMRLGTATRLDYQTLRSGTVDPTDFVPQLTGDVHYDVNLPLTLSGGFAGLDVSGAAIRASSDLIPPAGSIPSFFTGIDLVPVGLDRLTELRGVSLDMILDGVLATLDGLVAPDGVIFTCLPGIDQSLADLLGDGTDDFVESVKGTIKSVRGGDLGSVETDLNRAFNDLLGPDTDPFSLTYAGSAFIIELSVGKVLSENLDLVVNLSDYLEYIPLPDALVDLGLDINIGDPAATIEVEASADVFVGFGIDLSDVTDPVIYVDSSSGLSFALSAETADPVDLGVELELGDFGSVDFAVEDGTAAISLGADYGLRGNESGRYDVNAVGSNLALVVGGRAAIDLPLYFPTASLPFGGTSEDRDADGYADNVLHLGANLTNDAPEWDVVAPNMSNLFSIGAMLNDPQNIIDGLNGLFAGIRTGLTNDIASLGLPLIGDALQDAASGIDDGYDTQAYYSSDPTKSLDLRDQVVGLKDADGKYVTGLAGALQAGIDEGKTTVQVVQEALYERLGPSGLDLLRIEELGTNGAYTYRPLQSADEVQLVADSDHIQFNVILADTLFKTSVPIKFDVSLPFLGLDIDADIDVSLDCVFGLGFGFATDIGFYVDTAGVAGGG